MSAWQLLSDSLMTAAELAALLFVAPVSAMEPRTQREVSGAGIEQLRALHVRSSSLDVRLLGSLADVRVTQHFRNDSAETVSLSSRLPTVDEHTDALRIHRKERVVDLLRLDAGCDGEDDDDNGGQSAATGRAQLAVDESIADALQLAPGDTASIESIATQLLTRAGAAYWLALPDQLSVETQALLVDQGDVRFLVVVPHRRSQGIARLTLRPNAGASETIELGTLGKPSIAYVIPLASHAALSALAAGAIELETRTHDGIVWSTLPVQLRTDAPITVAGAPR